MFDSDDQYYEHMAFHERPRGFIDSLYAATDTVIKRARLGLKQLWTKVFSNQAAEQSWLISPYRTSEYVASKGGFLTSLRRNASSRGYVELDDLNKPDGDDTNLITGQPSKDRPDKQETISDWIIRLANHMGTGIQMSYSVIHYPRVSLHDGSLLSSESLKPSNQFNLAPTRLM